MSDIIDCIKQNLEDFSVHLTSDPDRFYIKYKKVESNVVYILPSDQLLYMGPNNTHPMELCELYDIQQMVAQDIMDWDDLVKELQT